ncbi:MAG: PD-(D/E)XK nuclease family protein [Endomicrobium sp.]|jgi:hypothetical protein|nr:PD-(D/E)XK nuclease family protein [Endomicrobium sp.]
MFKNYKISGSVINIDIQENIIDFTSDYILKSTKKTALITGGQRPFLFIKKNIAQKQKKSFFPPVFLTIHEFIEKIIFDNTEFIKISDIKAAFMIFKIIENEEPHLLSGKTSFASFIDWAFEILFFIEQLDLENVSIESLEAVKVNPEIGYDVPENINNLLRSIFKIRRSFHNALKLSSSITKGYSFLKTSEMEVDLLLGSFDEIVLMSPFYFCKTEIDIFKKIYNAKKLTVITQGDPKEYEILRNLYSIFKEPLPNICNNKKKYKLSIYSAFDDQSQGALLKNLIGKYSHTDVSKTAIVVPDSKILQSVISEISIITDRCNISTGYPVEKTAVFSLLDAVIEAQLSKKGQYYYSKDIMKVLANPLFKNMRFFGESSISRIVAHMIEEALDQNSESCLSNKVFVFFEEIISNKNLIREISLAATEAWKYISQQEVVKILKEIFDTFFISWGEIDTFNYLSFVLSNFLKKIYSLSSVRSYLLNIEAMEILLSLVEELKFDELAKEKFKNEEIFNIFKKLIKNKNIILLGSSLKELQILGFWESRSLSFDNVFIVGMTDSSMPKIRKQYSLIPKDIMYALGIDMANRELEIQKYHFQRLISCAKKVTLIYPDNEKDERSRFIELLIWNKQLEENDINAVKINKFCLPKFSIKQSVKLKYAKTGSIKKYLTNRHYTHSSFDIYLNCKLRFFFRYVLLLKGGLEVGHELLDKDIGNFIHSFLKGALHEGLDIEKIQSLQFKKDYLKKLENSFENSCYFKLREDAFMIKEVLKHRMTNVLDCERKRSYKNIYGCERNYFSSIKTKTGKIYNLSCRIDRIDSDGKNYMIFDYKTGHVTNNIILEKHIDLLTNNFYRQNIKKVIKSLQLPLYKYIFEKESGFTVSECGIYDIKKSSILKFPKQKEVYDKCIDTVKVLLDEISSGENFEFDEEDKANCKTCKYFYICR